MTDQFIPPQSVESESQVLGGMLLEQKTVKVVRDQLKATDFYREQNQHIFRAIMKLDKQGAGVDPVSVMRQLEKDVQKVRRPQASYLAELTGEVATTANIETHVKSVKETSLLRRLYKVSERIKYHVDKQELSAVELVDKVQESLTKVTERAADSDFVTMKELASEVFDNLGKGDEATRVANTGFVDLDNIMSGLHRSDLVIIAARPSMGKTCLAMNLARNVSKQGKSIAIISLEMSSRQLAERMVAEASGVDSSKMRKGTMTDEEVSEVADSLDRLSKTSIYIEDGRANTVPEIQAMCRDLKAKGKLDLVVIDYIQLMNPVRRWDSRVQEISEITRGLKRMAIELDVPVVALSQLSRTIEGRKEKRPQLHDLRDSGSIEQDADIVMFIYRHHYYAPKTGDPNVAEILIRKHRNGPIGNIKLYFDAEKQRFRDFREGKDDNQS